jgi:sulfatase modifying factor 1
VRKPKREFIMKTSLRWLFIVLALITVVRPVQAQLGIAPEGNQTVLFWPTTVTNSVLQSTTNLASPNWVTVSNGVPMTAISVTNTSPAMFFRLYDTNPPACMALIPAGSFIMGDTLDGESDALPVTNVFVSAFYMDTNLVSYSQWQGVYNWATNAGYGFDNAGAGKASNHPVYDVGWYDAVKWCNARSQQAGLTPVYYTDAGMTQVYTNGDTDAVYPNWAANGYRLPTEAEWEKAARGGLSGQRFPWGDTISESQANYYGCIFGCGFGYDSGPSGWNATYETGETPYTSPVGSFAPNGYGLFDMAGNELEWCWDWYGTPYGQPTTNNPTGPASGSSRMMRGGDWYDYASTASCAARYPVGVGPNGGFYKTSLRCVIGL